MKSIAEYIENRRKNQGIPPRAAKTYQPLVKPLCGLLVVRDRNYEYYNLQVFGHGGQATFLRHLIVVESKFAHFTVMQASTSPYTLSEGGWSDNSSDYTSTESGRSSPTPSDGPPEPTTKSETSGFGIIHLKQLLQCRLEQAGILPRNRTARCSNVDNPNDGPGDATTSQHLHCPSLFDHLGKLVVQANLLGLWITSADKYYFRLQVPNELDNPFFGTSIVTQLEALQPSLKVTTSIGLGCVTGQQTGPENLLMSLCHQLLSESNSDRNWDCSELLDDCERALSSLNSRWRESVLWTLFTYLLTSGRNQHRVIALSFRPDPATLQTLQPVIERLLAITKSTERNIQVLLLLGRGDGSIFETPYTATVDMTDSSTKESLCADISSWWLDVARARPSLKMLGDQLLSALSQHLDRPMLVFSTLCAIQTHPWVSKHQLSAGNFLFCSINSVLEGISESDRPLVTNILGILGYCCRPLTTRELAEALAASQPLPPIAQINENVVMDLEFDLCHTLRGLVFVKNGLVWSLVPYLVSDLMQGHLSSQNIPAWLDMGPNAEMRLAFTCLKYISHWSNTGGRVMASNETNFDSGWPFLNYAVTFWSHHFSQAYQQGALGSEISQIFDHDSGLIQTWLSLQAAFNPLKMTATAGAKAADLSQLSPAVIAKKLGCLLKVAVEIVSMAAQILPFVDGDVPSAIAISFWDRSQQIEDSPSVWMKRTRCRINPQSLIKAFDYLPETAFGLLLAHHDVVKQNAPTFLATAVRQGNGTIARECLRHVELDDQLLYNLLPISSAVEGGFSSVLQIMAQGGDLLGDSELKRHIMKRLLPRAAKYGHFELIDMLLSYNLKLAEPESIEILSATTEAGWIHTVEIMAKCYIARLPVNSPRKNPPLHCASSHNFLNIAQVLMESGALISETDEHGDTPVHIAARAGHLEMVRLLIPTNDQSGVGIAGKPLPELLGDMPRTSESALEMENGDGLLPVEVAAKCGHEAIVAELLSVTTQSALFSRALIPLAIRCENLSIVESLLDVPGIDIDEPGEEGRPALAIACSIGSVPMARKLLERGADAWPSLPFSWRTPWYALCKRENAPATLEIARLLVAKLHRYRQYRQLDLDLALASAATAGKEDLLAIMLDAGADKNSRSGRHNDHPLHLCARYNREAAARLLLVRGADRTVSNDSQKTPLDEATSAGHVGIMRLLLQAGERYPLKGDKCPLTQLSERAETAALEVILQHQEEFRGAKILGECFSIALRNDNNAIVTLLLRYDADADSGSRARRYGNALNECAYYGNVKMARVLLDHPGGVKGNAVDSDAGRYHTPLIAAVSWTYQAYFGRPWHRPSEDAKRKKRRLMKQQKMIDYLRSKGGDPRIKGGSFGTMLNAAAAGGEPDLVTYVLDKVGFGIDEVDAEGRNAAHMACSKLNIQDAVDTLGLLSKRASGSNLLWSPDKHGRLPLHFACGGQRRAVVEYLLSHENNNNLTDYIHKTDKDGWTPLHWACRGWDIKFVQFLVSDCKATTDSRANNGWTPWDVAVLHDNMDFAYVLDRLTCEPDADSCVKKGEASGATCDSCQVSGSFHTLPT